jgi:serine/threonine kinase 32
LEENPLKVKKRAIQPKKSSSNDELATTIAMDEKQLLEERFISYDYTKPEENEKLRSLSKSSVSDRNRKKVRTVMDTIFQTNILI